MRPVAVSPPFYAEPRFVQLEHCRLAYRQTGSGETLLLIHGYPLSGITFRHIAPDLAGDFTCYAPDLPGLGETQWTDATDFSFAGQAETLKAFIDTLGVSSYAIVAHDTGGTIARRLAVIDRDRVSRMALIGTEIPGHRPPWIQFFQKIANPKQTRTFAFLMSQRWFRRSGAAFGGCFADPSLIDGEFYDLFIRPLLADKRRISGQTRYLLGIDWTLLDALKIDHAKITAPVLLVWGEDDPVFPVEEARAMAAQLGNCAGFVAIPGGKLFVHEENPEAVLPVLRDFLLRARPPTPAGRRDMSDVTAPSSTHAPIRRPRAASYKLLDAGAIAMMAILVGAFIAPTVAWIEWVQPAAAPPARPVELLMLIRAALMSLLLPIVQIGMQIRRFGGPAIRGNRDYSPRMSGAAGRIARAHANAVESLTAFAAVVLAAHALGVSNRWTIAAATLYLAARIVHAASYALGVTILRSSAFYAGWIATVTIAIAAL